MLNLAPPMKCCGSTNLLRLVLDDHHMVCALCVVYVQNLIFSKISRCANPGWLGLDVTEADCHIFLMKKRLFSAFGGNL